MKRKPAINLLRGNIPEIRNVRKRSSCWRCSVTLAKNDKVFEVPGPSHQNSQGDFYRDRGKRYCQECMKDNIARTEKELDKLKRNVG